MQLRIVLLALSVAVGVETSGRMVAQAQSPSFSPTNLRCDPSVGIVANATTAPNPTDKCWQAVSGQTGVYQLTSASQTCRTEALPASSSLAAPKTLSMDPNGTFMLDGASLKPKCVLDAQGTADLQALATKVKGPPADLSVYLTNGLIAASGPQPANVSGIPQTPPTDTSADTAPCAWPDPEANAKDKKRIGSSAYIGIDLTEPAPTVAISPARNVILPNQGIIVGVCQRVSNLKKLQIAVGGTRGFTSLGTNGQTQALVRGAAPKTTITEVPFSPRQPGTADVTLTDVSTSQSQQLFTLELQVDTLYWGAVRFGLGTLISNWNGYQITTFAGSNQPEIRSNHTLVAFELVNGFAPYLFDLACPGHARSETGGCNTHVAPFIGFGLVGASSQGVEALSSFHVGLEVEFASSFSIAADFVLRRTSGLAQGYHVGSPVAASATIDDVTGDTWQPGFALVINASPSFLTFATGSGNAGGKSGSK
jgi:hypothetical protein